VVQCSPEREAIAVLLPASQSQSNESILNPGPPPVAPPAVAAPLQPSLGHHATQLKH